MLFSCRPVGLEFIEGSPWRFENAVELDAPPARVFDLFADGESWPRWFPGIRRVVWTSPDPKGVGTTRTVTLATATVHEHFLCWDPGRRFTFRFTGADRPLFRAGIEDYRLEPASGGRTRFSYGVYLDPHPVVRALAPITRPMFGRTFRGGAQGLRDHLAERPAEDLGRA